MKSQGRRGLFICEIVLLLTVFAYFYGPALGIYYATKRAVKDDPSFARVPEPLPTNNIAQAASKKLTFFDVEFRVPWNGEVQIKQWQRVVRIQFIDGQFVMLFDPSSRVDRIKVLAANSPGHDSERVFGREALRSNYAFLSAILNVTPRDISPWMPRVELVRNSVFLMLKGAELANTQTALFRFQNERVKGFQRGDLARSPSVILDAFDDADREYEIFVGTTKDTKGLVSQEDVNLILSTLKPIQASSR
ncbi:MAG: hypothetical protein DMG36_17065 [Acidobacteria bacterium]|nr:MAG: hypothetical protein DMG36_17065 [Acidobacteriota bacterium]